MFIVYPTGSVDFTYANFRNSEEVWLPASSLWDSHSERGWARWRVQPWSRWYRQWHRLDSHRKGKQAVWARCRATVPILSKHQSCRPCRQLWSWVGVSIADVLHIMWWHHQHHAFVWSHRWHCWTLAICSDTCCCVSIVEHGCGP